MSATRPTQLTRVEEWNDGSIHSFQDCLVAEEPLEIRVNDEPFTVTMRTPGHDLELAAGLLFTEGVMKNDSQVSFEYGPTRNVVEARLDLCGKDMEEFRRNLVATASCGICGRASIDSIRRQGIARPASSLSLKPEALCGFPEKLKSSQAVFGKTGGLHAAALFNKDGELMVVREDIGRHNAVDKVVGWALQQKKIPLSDYTMMVSGRGGFEIIQKALVAGVPIFVSISAPSSLAVQLAREFSMTLIGFLHGTRFVIYSVPSRVRAK